jgi:stearoyl-CoA desaturase (delta-9 desaturase)
MFKNLLRPKEGFLVFLQLLALCTTVFALFTDHNLSHWAVAALGYTALFGIGITVTFHRLLAHRSYGLARPLEYLFSLFANLGCTGSSVGWVFVHRAHHAYTDKEGDPHSPVVYGPWGAITGQYGGAFDKWLVRDIINDPVHRFFHDYHHALLVALPVLATLLFGSTGFIFAWAVPVFLNTAVSRLSNWIDHEPAFGKKTFQTDDAAHNVWWWSLVSFGEGWHNNHHARPGSYRFGIGSQFDPGKYFINALKAVGLAWDARPNDAEWRKRA